MVKKHMKFIDGNGEVNLQKENGEIITIQYNQVIDLIEENQKLRKIDNVIKNQLSDLKNSINENQIPVSSEKLENILRS